MSSPVGKPGGSSQAQYDALTRSWRRRNRKLFLAVAAICGSVIVGSFAIATIWPLLAWIAGVFAGAALCFYLFARMSPPGWIENWQVGAWGEEATAAALAPLKTEGWVVTHDLPAHHGNIDHLVVGPSGVFLLDSKRINGTVTVSEGRVSVQRLDNPTLGYTHPGAGHVIALAKEAHDRVLAASRLNVWVMPVMVLWADFPQGVTEDRCTFVHGDRVADWLRAQPVKISADRIEQVSEMAIRALSL